MNASTRTEHYSIIETHPSLEIGNLSVLLNRALFLLSCANNLPHLPHPPHPLQAPTQSQPFPLPQGPELNTYIHPSLISLIATNSLNYCDWGGCAHTQNVIKNGMHTNYTHSLY